MRVARPTPNCSPVDHGLPGQSPQKGAFPLVLGMGTGSWISEALKCARIVREGGEAGGARHNAYCDLHKIRVIRQSRTRRNADLRVCAPGGGRSAGGRWVGASTQGERQRGRGWSHSSAEEHSGPLRGSVQGIERRSAGVAVSGCMQGHALQTRCKYLCGDVPTPRRSEGYTPKCSDFSDHPRVCVISHLPILAKTRILWQGAVLPVWWVIL